MNPRKHLKYTLLFLILSISPLMSGQIVKHDRLISFEEEKVPNYVKGINSRVSISDEHYKDGTQSLKWNFKPGGQLHISRNLHFEEKDPTGKDTYLSTFVVWIYNNEPVDKSVSFQFLKKGKVCSSFTFGLNYKGWRAAWVSYERDMEGQPVEGMNQIRVVAPEDYTGELYIDQLITAVKADHRHHTPDAQVPFVNKETQSHWLVLLKYSMIEPDRTLDDELTEKRELELKRIEKRFTELIYTRGSLKKQELDKLWEEYKTYRIIYRDGKVSGLPLYFTRASEAFERLVPDWKNIFEKNNMELRKYFTLMERIARAYHNAKEHEDKERLKEMFISMYDHVTDQGVAYGSGLGNATHYGYSFRGIYTAYFLMRDVLRETGRLTDAEKTLNWYAMTNEIFIKPEKSGIDMDAFNTTTTGRMSSILIMNNSPEKVRYLNAFSRWIDNGCMPSTGLDGSFKSDGAAFHHCNNYPAYAVGGLTGATNSIWLLNNTSFAISEQAHQTVKNVLLTMRFYCNRTHFPLAMAGRHPDGKGELSPSHYSRMATAGSPDGREKIDREMAAAYLRLISDRTIQASEQEGAEPLRSIDRLLQEHAGVNDLRSQVKAEKDPSGNMALGYGCISVQRRSNWSAVVRGHSRYLWAAEHYLGANLYGRYLAHGSMQLFTGKKGEIVTPKSSGWIQDGFDWGRIPGTTAIHLPIEQLKADVQNVDVYSGFEEMLYSDEAFAGGISQNQTNGAFGMKLHEHDKYNGSHRARKSYHFFDNRIVCLGSGIENDNADYATETTILQLAVTDSLSMEWWNKPQPDNYWIDHLRTGYYVPDNTRGKLNFEKNFPQLSRAQNTGEKTKGNWVVLTVDHGKSPKGESYEYMVVPNARKKAMDSLVERVPYKVLQHDNNAHIVKDFPSRTTSYVLFETPEKLPEGIIQKADTSCLLMIKENENSFLLTVCNPDLALYSGPSDELYDENGKRVERSIYSRPWKFNESQVIPVTITLKGYWYMNEKSDCRILSVDDEQTVIQFDSKDGKSIDLEIYPKEENDDNHLGDPDYHDLIKGTWKYVVTKKMKNLWTFEENKINIQYIHDDIDEIHHGTANSYYFSNKVIPFFIQDKVGRKQNGDYLVIDGGGEKALNYHILKLTPEILELKDDRYKNHTKAVMTLTKE